MKVAWLCPYPLEKLRNIPVPFRRKHIHSGTWIVNLARALVENCPDIELHVIAESPLISRPFTVKEDGISVHVIRDESSVPFVRRGWPPAIPLHLITRYWFSRRKITVTLRDLAPDIVHAHGTEMANAITAVHCGFPAIVSLQGIMHNLAEHYPENRTFRMRVPLEREVLERGRFFISKTPFAREFIRSMNLSARIFDIENTMHPAFFRVQPSLREGRRILFVGSVVKAKGIRELFEAAARLGDVRLVIVGPDRGGLAEDLRSRHPGLHVEWKGVLPSEDVALEMGKADLLALPSYMDTSPNVVSEAMCAGLPVVATRVGGIPDMIEDGRTGMLVPARDATVLASAIERLLGDAVLRERLGRAARAEAMGRFSPDLAARKVKAAYETVLREWTS